VDFKSLVTVPRVGSDKQVPFQGLTLVKCREPQNYEKQIPYSGPVPGAAAMRHNFAIWALEKPGTSRRSLHLYYCVRCKWTFQVDDRSGAVTPLDQDGSPLQEIEAGKRLATFGVGHCPAFSRLTEHARLTRVVTRPEALRVRLTTLLFTVRRIWHRPRSPRRDLLRSLKA
jgi:hypothetical protein